MEIDEPTEKQEWVPGPLSISQKTRLLRAYITLVQMLYDRGYMLPKLAGKEWKEWKDQYSNDEKESDISTQMYQFLTTYPYIANTLVTHMMTCTILLTTRLNPEKELYYQELKEKGEVGTPPPFIVVFMCRDEKLGTRSIGSCVHALHKINATLSTTLTSESEMSNSPKKSESILKHAIMLCEGIISGPARKRLYELQYKGRIDAKDQAKEKETDEKEEMDEKDEKVEKVETGPRPKSTASVTTAKAVIADAKKSGYTLEAFSIDEFQRNPSRHKLVPKHVPLYGKEKETIIKRFQGPQYFHETQQSLPHSIEHFPKIRVSDPQIRYLGVPIGTMIQIERHVVNHQILPYWRIVIPEDFS